LSILPVFQHFFFLFFFFYGTLTHFQAKASPLLGFETTKFLQGQDVSHMPNPQQKGPWYLSLSGMGGSNSNYAATSITF
jgi:hypothetical protein